MHSTGALLKVTGDSFKLQPCGSSPQITKPHHYD